MKLDSTKWEELAENSIYEQYGKLWECDLFSIVADEANAFIDENGRDDLRVYYGHYEERFKKYTTTTIELLEADLKECYSIYLKNESKLLDGINIYESSKEIPDAAVYISKSDDKHEIHVSSAFIYYLNYASQIYSYFCQPDFRYGVTKRTAAEFVLESMQQKLLSGSVDFQLDKYFMLKLLKNVKNFYKADTSKKMDQIFLPNQSVDLPIMVMYARQFMIMHELSHVLLKDNMRDYDNYQGELFVDSYAISLMLDGISKRKDLNDVNKTLEIMYLLKGVILFFHCLSLPHRYFDRQELRIDFNGKSVPLLPNPIIRKMSILRTVYSRNYLKAGSSLPYEVVRFLYEVSSITFEPEYHLLTGKSKSGFSWGGPSGASYALEVYRLSRSDEQLKKIIPTLEKLRTNLFDIFAPDHDTGREVLKDFLDIYLEILAAAYKTGYAQNRGGKFSSIQEELEVYAERYFEMRSGHMTPDHQVEFRKAMSRDIRRILEIY